MEYLDHQVKQVDQVLLGLQGQQEVLGQQALQAQLAELVPQVQLDLLVALGLQALLD